MLVGKFRPVSVRITAVLVALVGVTAGGIGGIALGAAFGLWEWPPRPSSGLGVACGVAGGGIVLFEMAILLKKWFRGRRLGSTLLWMRLHVWLGLVCLPVVLVHTGFGVGGFVPGVTAGLFLLTIASGVWGLILQQWLPQKIHADVPAETVASQVDFVGGHHAREASRLVAVLVEGEHAPAGADLPPAAVGSRTAAKGIPLVVGQPAADLRTFETKLLMPYLRGGGGRSPLASRAEGERWFARLRDAVHPDARPVLARLQELCDLRRQGDQLARLNRWLHSWLLVHTPVSVAMTGFMCVHAARALKFW